MEPRPAASARTYRRAVGLEVRLDPCRGCSRATITARRHGGDTVVELDLSEASALLRLKRWSTPEEAGLPAATLGRWVTENLAFEADGRPPQDLYAGPVWDGAAPVSLAPHVWPTFVMDHKRSRGPVPFMPRHHTLQGARLTGVHLGVMEAGSQVLGVALSCCAHHGMVLRELMAHLHAPAPTGLGKDHAALLAVLDQLGLLEPAPVPLDVPDGSLTWLGHAAVLLKDGGTRVLVDPLFHPRSLPPPVQGTTPPDARTLGPVDAVLITHGDNDHFNVQALGRLARNTPLLLPRARKAQPFHVDMAAVAALLGFTNVAFVEPWETTRVGALKVLAAPFVGEDWGLTLPKVTWLVQGPTLCAYLGADAAAMPEVMARLGQEHVVDVALLGVGGCEEALVMPKGFGYGNFYARWIAHAQRNRWVQHCAGPQESAQAARLLRARHVFGYAAGGADFIALAYSDRGTHQYLAALLVEPGDPQPLALPLGVPAALPLR